MKKLFAYLLALNMLANIGILASAEESETEETTETTCATGAISMTDEEIENLKSAIPQIIEVRPNALFYERLQEEYSETFSIENITQPVAEYGEEIVNSYCETISLLEDNEILLPSKVDNSQENTFPIIGDQGDIGSCVGWSLGYYQLTNNANRIRGTVAKDENGNIDTNVYSPNWVYNLGNNGEDNGMKFDNGMGVLYTYGCPTIEKVPVMNNEEDETSYKTWFPAEDVWKNALYNKCDVYYGTINLDNLNTPITSPDAECLDELKKLLSNGYVVSVSTNVNTLSVKKGYTSQGLEEYVWPIIWNATDGNHAVTIVGYDDNFKTDINRNGKYELSEYGAFKIANSWGKDTSNHNEGFVWLAYDALNKVSAVTNITDTTRMSAFRDDIYYVIMPQKEYQPLLTATLNIESLYQCILIGNIGIEDAENPEMYFEKNITSRMYTDSEGVEHEHIYTIAFNNRGGICNLFGTSGYKTGTVVFDLTPLLQKFELKEGQKYNVYIKLKHSVDLNATSTIKSYTIKDYYKDKLFVSDEVPIYANQKNLEIKVTIDYISSINTVSQKTGFALGFNSILNENTIDDKNIKVFDVKENSLPIDLSIGLSNKTIDIALKDNIFESGFYKVRILEGLKSIGGNGLSRKFEIAFYVPFY